MRTQRPIKNRQKLSAGTEQRVKDAVRAEARKHGCSMSFVVNVILGTVLRVSLKERYDQ
jgi:hypothetical protein